MDNLTEKFQKSLLKSLMRVYIKCSVVQFYFPIFPYLSSLNLSAANPTKNMIVAFLKEQIRRSYLPPLDDLLQRLFTVEERDQLLTESIVDVLRILNGTPILSVSVFDQLLSSFNLSDCESSQENVQLNRDKYVVETFYLETFVRMVTPTGESILRLSDVPNIVSALNGLSDAQFNESISSLRAGLRLIYLPSFNMNAEKTAQVKNDVIAKRDRINYISGKFEPNGDKQVFHPLLMGEVYLPLTRQTALGLFDQTKMQLLVSSLKRALIDSVDFKKIFHYILPVNVFETFLVFDLLEEYKLLTKVYENNKVYSVTTEPEKTTPDFHQGLITMIQNLANMENPNAL